MRITKSDIDRITLLFLDHQGNKKSLTKEQLFKEWFGERYDESNAINMYSSRAKWAYLRRLMKWMRKKSSYYLVNNWVGSEYKYYLVTSEEDGHFFNDRLESIVRGIRYVQGRYYSYLKDSVVPIRSRRKRKLNRS